MEKRLLLLEKETETKPAPTTTVAPASPEPATKPEPARPEPAVRPEPAKPEPAPSPQPEKKQARQTEKQTSPERQEEESQKTIDTPNYDFIEELTPEEQVKVYKIQREEQQSKPKPKSVSKKLRLAIFSIVAALCFVWGVVNIVEISDLGAGIEQVTQEYQMNLETYLAKLATMDTASSYNDLFDTVPKTPAPPSTVGKISNFFDRLCNFIARLFGG